jgi:hypothetical protein
VCAAPVLTPANVAAALKNNKIPVVLEVADS